MSVEQRLVGALDRTSRVEPSPDLWSRVVHSIDEDQLHRQRVIRTTLSGVAILAALVTAAVLSLTDGASGTIVRWQAMEAIETVALVCLIVALGPAIRRFGRGYATDLFTSSRGTAEAMMRLLDLAYYLVFAGFILGTVEFLDPLEASRLTLGEQLEDAAIRIGGLLLTMGVLHAITLIALPLTALIVNSTRTGHKVPRWVWIIIIIGAWQLSGLPFLIGGVLFGSE
jgi:hypothetical protein